MNTALSSRVRPVTSGERVKISSLFKTTRSLLLLCAVLISFSWTAWGQNNEWTWSGGNSLLPDGLTSSVSGWPGVYGTEGVASAANAPGGRENSMTWTDSAGNLWLFGGLAYDSAGTLGCPNDLWEFSVSTGQWTWVNGANTVSGSYACSPATYGTRGTPAKNNIPMGRMDAATWIDKSGNLWMFGGQTYEESSIGSASVFLNDLWEFNLSTMEWTWMGGSSALPSGLGFPGVYGSKGTADSANLPGSREAAAAWTDGSGNLWMFGGLGIDAADDQGNLNDLWKYDIAHQTWTWMSGVSVVPANSQPLAGVYGTKGQASAANVPGGRLGAAAWTAVDGKLWLFGGRGWDSTGTYGYENDLWMFDPATGWWTWMGGQAPAAYGTLQTPDPANLPGGRLSASTWVDANGNFWLFGGEGTDANGDLHLLNDLWQFMPATDTWSWMSGSSTGGLAGQRAGVYGSAGSAALGNTPGARETAAAWTDGHGNLWLLGGYGCDAGDNCGYLNDLWKFQLNTGGMTAAATPQITPGTGVYTSVQNVSITDATPGVDIYYQVNNATPAQLYTGPISVSQSESLTAIAGGHGYANSTINTANLTLNLPVTAAPTFNVPAGSYPNAQSVVLSDATPGAAIYYTANGLPTVNSTLYSGPIQVGRSQIIQAFAVAPGYAPSAVVRVEYGIAPTSSLGEWVWVSGSTDAGTLCFGQIAQCGHPGAYGTLGAADSTSTPGSRYGAASWTDRQGNLWLFGGYGWDANGDLDFPNDLWKFDPNLRQWAWMGGSKAPGTGKGIPGIYGALGTVSATNYPGSRTGAGTWVDAEGNLWLFGGDGFDAAGSEGALNDLWKFTPATGLWTWVSGSSIAGTPQDCRNSLVGCGPSGVYGAKGTATAGNVPGGRNPAATWTDAQGALWLFGGTGMDASGVSGDLNDLWKFDPSTQLWTWISGSSQLLPMTAPTVWYGEYASYGPQGVALPGNVPGGRNGSTGWADASGNLWLTGGWGYDQVGQFGFLNDLWKFDIATQEWTWVGGFSHTSGLGYEDPVYGVQGIAGAANQPGFRSGASSAVDSSGNVWMFGGFGTSAAALGNLNELWSFNPSATQWTWWSGGLGSNPAGSIGTKGVPSPANVPQGRTSGNLWLDRNGNVWIFGGDLYQIGQIGNDLWEYIPAANVATQLPPAALPSFSVPGGTYSAAQTVTLTSTTPGAKIYYTVDGTAPTVNSTLYAAPLTVSSTETIEAIAAASGFTNSAAASATYTIKLPATFSLSASPSSLSLNPGQQGTSTLTLTPSNGFSTAVTFACSGLPAGVTCAFSPSSVTPAGSAVQTTLTISASSSASNSTGKSSPFLSGTALALAACFLFGRRRWRTHLLALFVLAACLVPFAACGGGGSNGASGGNAGNGGGSGPVTSSVTVTASGGNVQQNTSISLTLN